MSWHRPEHPINVRATDGTFFKAHYRGAGGRRWSGATQYSTMVRIKHRYLLLNLLYPEHQNKITSHTPSPNHLSASTLTRAVRDQITNIFGDYGAGKTASSLKGTLSTLYLSRSPNIHIVLYLSTATSTAIIRSSREHYRMVWAALTLLTHLPRMDKADQTLTPVVVHVVRVSGTIRKAEEEAIRRARAMIAHARRGEKEAERGDTRLLDEMFNESNNSTKRRAVHKPYQGIESDTQSEEIE